MFDCGLLLLFWFGDLCVFTGLDCGCFTDLCLCCLFVVWFVLAGVWLVVWF